MLKRTDQSDAGPSHIDEAQRRLADALPILVMISGGDGTVQYFNRRWHEFTGQPCDGHDIAQDWQSYMHPDDAGRVQTDWGAAVQRGDRVIAMRYRLRHHGSGQYRWFSAQAVAVEDTQGAIMQWIGAAVDVDDEVTARAALEQLLSTQTAVAESYQRASLPAKLPQIAGLRFDAQYRASAHELLVGGDWYDVFALPDRRVAVTIGDIAGHGLRAAVLMNKVQQSARAVALWEARTGVPGSRRRSRRDGADAARGRPRADGDGGVRRDRSRRAHAALRERGTPAAARPHAQRRRARAAAVGHAAGLEIRSPAHDVDAVARRAST